MTENIIVSIIVCTRNRAVSLSEMLRTLRSINASCEWEVLLIDNASTDDTRATIEAAIQIDTRLKYYYCEQVGLGAAREFSRQRAAGRMLAFTDDDCLIASDYVDQIVRAFSDYPNAGVIGGRIEQYNPAHLALTIDERTDVFRTPAYSFVPTGAFHGANLSFRAKAIDLAGGFDSRLGAGTDFPCEDIDAVARVVSAGFDAIFDPRVIVQHDHGRSEADRPEMLAAYNRGRGAYFARLIANNVTRKSCKAAWLDQASNIMYVSHLKSLWDEVTFASRYATRHLRLMERAAVTGVVAQVLIAGHLAWSLRLSRRILGRGRLWLEN